MHSPAPPYILALDVASRTGVCEGRAGETPIFYTKQFAKEGDEHEDVFAAALLWLVERLKVDLPDAVYIEAPLSPGVYGKTNAETTTRLLGMWATLAAAVKVKGVRYRRAKVSTVRAAFIGHGRLEGAEAKRRAFDLCKALGWAPKNRDEADAGAIFWWASSQMAPKLTQIITPMMQQRVATTIGGADFSDVFKGKDLPQRKGTRVQGRGWEKRR
jgi:hypothetical protein